MRSIPREDVPVVIADNGVEVRLPLCIPQRERGIAELGSRGLSLPRGCL